MTLSFTSVQAQTEISKNERVMELHQAIEIQKEAFKEAKKMELQTTQPPLIETLETPTPTEDSQGLFKKAFDALFGLFQ